MPEESFRLLIRVLLLVLLVKVATACKDGSSCPDFRLTLNNTLCVNGNVIELLPDTVLPTALYACSDTSFDDIKSYVIYDHPLLQIKSNISWINTTVAPTFDKNHLGRALVQYIATGSVKLAASEYDTRSTYQWIDVMYWKGIEIFRQLHKCTLLVRGTSKEQSSTENPAIPNFSTTTPQPGTETSTKSTHSSGSKARFEMSLLLALVTIVYFLSIRTYFKFH